LRRRWCKNLKNGIINAIVLKATNALGESMNAKIQKINSQVCGYRNRQHFRNAIMFHLADLICTPKSHLPTQNLETPKYPAPTIH